MNKTNRFSYYSAPVTNPVPCKEMDLEDAYKEIVSGTLKPVTDLVHGNNSLKTSVLPYITPSGIFTYRKAEHLLRYSGIIHADIDHLEELNVDPEALKKVIAADIVLSPSFLHTSPSGKGLKVHLIIEGAKAEEHSLYFEALSHYFYITYGIKIDPACRDISRACFLAHDPKAILTDGTITREALLEYVPPKIPSADAKSKDAKYCVSTTGAPVFGKSTSTYPTGQRPSDILNRMPVIHERAESAMKACGWVQKGELWTRPGKNGGTSSKFNFYDKEGIFIMTCFSSNSTHFRRKGYSDVQIFCELEYGSDWSACITDLARQYLPPLV